MIIFFFALYHSSLVKLLMQYLSKILSDLNGWKYTLSTCSMVSERLRC